MATTTADFERFVRSIPEFADARLGEPKADGAIHRFPLHPRDHKRSGWYVLRHFDRGLWGMVGSWRTGERHEFKEFDRELDPFQRRALETEIKKAREAAERAQRAKAKNAAERAKRLLMRATRTTDWTGHDWATRKQLATPLWRLPGGSLLVPLQDDAGNIVSAQIILKDGTRRFISGSRTRGAHFVIGDLDGAARVLICEGVSTGDALHRATGDPAVCAMSAYNLPEVARIARRKAKAAPIVVCADNDARVVDGKLVNPGVEYARKAAEAVGGALAIPPEPGTDFHDVFARHGAEAVKQIIDGAVFLGAAAKADAQPTRVEDRWNGLFRLDRFGLPRRDVENIARWIEHHVGERLVLDTFTGRLLLDGSHEDVPERLLRMLYETAGEVSWSPELMQQGIEYATGIRAVARRDSLRERLDAIEPWCGEVDWIGMLIIDGMKLADDYSEELAYVVLRTFLVGAIARIVEPGSKMDGMLVLVGPQGLGKSTFARMLAFEPTWFTDAISMHRLEDKDELMQLEGVHIVELPELSGLRRADMSAVKKWITKTEDAYRPPYGRKVVSRPRRFVCIATTNDDSFLTDVENRRFWVLRVSDIDLGWVAQHRDFLYAQAYALWRDGAEPVLPSDAAAMMTVEHERATERDPWEVAILELAEERVEFDSRAVLDRVGKPLGQATRGDEIRIGHLVRRLLPDWRKVRIREGNRRRWVFRHKDA